MADPKNVSQHSSFVTHKKFLWAKLALLISVLSIIAYIRFDFQPVRNGGTWLGYGLGTIATILILWLMLLGMRKRVISPGRWSLKAWTSAHIYLGMSLIIIATLHSGFQVGWNIHTLAYALMMLVILSGFFGLYAYVSIPRQMSDNRAQMGQADMLNELANLNRILYETAQPLDNVYIERITNSIEKTKLGGSIFTRLKGGSRKRPTQEALNYFQAEVLVTEEAMRSPILNVISVLERKNSIITRIRRHTRFRALLDVWLYIHIPMSFALLAALTAHIISVFYYS